MRKRDSWKVLARDPWSVQRECGAASMFLNVRKRSNNRQKIVNMQPPNHLVGLIRMSPWLWRFKCNFLSTFGIWKMFQSVCMQSKSVLDKSVPIVNFDLYLVGLQTMQWVVNIHTIQRIYNNSTSYGMAAQCNRNWWVLPASIPYRAKTEAHVYQKNQKKVKYAFGGTRNHEYEYTRTWVEPLRPLGHECYLFSWKILNYINKLN